jgi:putative ABC transport system permease protein
LSSIPERLFRASLRVYPPRFRERLSESMIETFHDRYVESLGKGRAHAVVLTVRTLAGTLLWGTVERLRPSFAAPRTKKRRTPTVMHRLSLPAHEIRFAFRSLYQRPGFTAVAVLTLALGVGANSSIFSVVDGVLLKPFEFEDPEELVTVHADWSGPGAGIGPMSYPDMADLESELSVFESLVGVSSTTMTLTELGEPVVLSPERVTKGLMETLGIAPLLGRDIRADEFGESGPSVAVVSYEFWQSRLGGAPDVLGRVIRLSGIPYEVVGVAPRGFDYPDDAELWIPRRMSLDDCGRGCHTMTVVGRLADGVSLDEARAEANRLAVNLEKEFPDNNARKRFLVRSLKDYHVGEVRAGLLLLLGAVALVALIACANVANLLLSRATSRTGEIAIRTAIGASQAHLVLQSLIESALLSLAGGVAGLGIAAASLAVLKRLPTGIPRIEEVQIDGSVLLFTLGAVVVATFVFGLAPAFALARSSVRAGLGPSFSGGTADNPGRRRFRTLLLVGEVALSALLLVGAGLVLRSFAALYAVDVGFETQNIHRFSLLLPEVRYDSIDVIRNFYRELEDRIRHLPGVESVGSVWGPPLGRGHASGEVLVQGRPKPPPGQERGASIHPVGPGWLETMQVPLRRGRLLDASDDSGAEPVAVVNETFVKLVFPGEDPLDKIVQVTIDMGFGSPDWRIVGVVGDVRSRAITSDPSAQIYVPHGHFGPEDLTVNVRMRPGAPTVLPAVRTLLVAMDPDVPLYRVETVEEAVARHVAPTRFYLTLIGTFAALASFLAAVGLYGVVAYNASQRSRELGLRMALGAERRGILGMVVLQGMAPATAGLVLGLVGAFFGERVLDAILFGVEPRDLSIYAGTSAVLLAVALVASIVPAHRASRVDPVTVLRSP